MKTKLSKWTWNAKKWREENGYTTPEWEIYTINMINKMFIILIIGIGIGIALREKLPG